MTLQDQSKEFSNKMDDINFVKKQRTFFYILNIIYFAIIVGILYIKPVRFAITHYQATTDFMNRYTKIEVTAKNASKEILDNWSKTGEIK